MGRKELIINKVSKTVLTSYFCIKRGRLERTIKHRSYSFKGPEITGLFVSIKNRLYKVSHVLFRLSHSYKKIPVGCEVDHINRDYMDNRVCNLRLATWSQSQANRGIKSGISGLRGVYPSGSKSNPWRARIRCDGRRIELGLFKDKKSAAEAYNEYAHKIFGKFAVLNKV